MLRKLIRSGLFAAVVFAGIGAAGRAPEDPKPIKISATRFKFEPNEITVKKGQHIVLEVTSSDVNHGLVLDGLGVKIDVPKGKTSEVKFTAEDAGTFEGKCAHFCGSGHGAMKFTVHVTE